MKKLIIVSILAGAALIIPLLAFGLTVSPKTPQEKNPQEITAIVTNKGAVFPFQHPGEDRPPIYNLVMENGDHVKVDKETWDILEPGDSFTYTADMIIEK